MEDALLRHGIAPPPKEWFQSWPDHHWIGFCLLFVQRLYDQAAILGYSAADWDGMTRRIAFIPVWDGDWDNVPRWIMDCLWSVACLTGASQAFFMDEATWMSHYFLPDHHSYVRSDRDVIMDRSIMSSCLLSDVGKGCIQQGREEVCQGRGRAHRGPESYRADPGDSPYFQHFSFRAASKAEKWS